MCFIELLDASTLLFHTYTYRKTLVVTLIIRFIIPLTFFFILMIPITVGGIQMRKAPSIVMEIQTSTRLPKNGKADEAFVANCVNIYGNSRRTILNNPLKQWECDGSTANQFFFEDYTVPGTAGGELQLIAT